MSTAASATRRHHAAHLYATDPGLNHWRPSRRPAIAASQLRFVNGKVVQVQYAGATDIGDAEDAVCGEIVRTCVKHAPAGQ